MKPFLFECGHNQRSVRVVPLDECPPSNEIDARVIENDACLVLSPPPETILVPKSPLSDLIDDAIGWEAPEPGQVLIEPGPPLILHAIVHDLSRDPSWSEDWIRWSYESIMEEVAKRSMRAICLPLLGTVHGRMPAMQSRDMLITAVQESNPPQLEIIWLHVPRQSRQTPTVYHFLQDP